MKGEKIWVVLTDQLNDRLVHLLIAWLANSKRDSGLISHYDSTAAYHLLAKLRSLLLFIDKHRELVRSMLLLLLL